MRRPYRLAVQAGLWAYLVVLVGLFFWVTSSWVLRSLFW